MLAKMNPFFLAETIKYLLSIFRCFRCRRALAISMLRSRLSPRRPCSDGWMSASWKRNVIPVPSGREKSWRDGSRGREETSWQKWEEWGRKEDRLWKTPQNDVASVSTREAKITSNPSPHPPNNGRIYHAFPIHRDDYSSGEEMTWKQSSS